MIKIISLIVFTTSFFLTHAQNKFQDLSSLDKNTSKIKIVMLTADWCNICRINENKIFKKKIQNILIDYDISIFKLKENFESPIKFNDTTYFFEKNGLNEGSHQIIKKFLKKNQINYPTFIFLNSKNRLLYIWEGFIDIIDIKYIINRI